MFSKSLLISIEHSHHLTLLRNNRVKRVVTDTQTQKVLSCVLKSFAKDKDRIQVSFVYKQSYYTGIYTG